jgi:hypothetical protein
VDPLSALTSRYHIVAHRTAILGLLAEYWLLATNSGRTQCCASQHTLRRHCPGPPPPVAYETNSTEIYTDANYAGGIWGGANLASCILIQLIESAPLEWEFGIVYSQHTLFGILLLTLPPSHSYTHRTRSASPVLHDRSRVLFTPKKNFFLVVSGN